MKPRLSGRSAGTKSHPVPSLLRIHVAERRDPSHHGRRRCVSVRERGLLVVRKTYGLSKGQWTIPSGYVERHESIVQSVEREVKEETNIVGRTGSLLAVRNRVPEAANDTFLVFRLAHISGRPQPDHDQVSRAAFGPLDEAAISAE